VVRNIITLPFPYVEQDVEEIANTNVDNQLIADAHNHNSNNNTNALQLPSLDEQFLVTNTNRRRRHQRLSRRPVIRFENKKAPGIQNEKPPGWQLYKNQQIKQNCYLNLLKQNLKFF
jgi:hypothetical protein